MLDTKGSRPVVSEAIGPAVADDEAALHPIPPPNSTCATPFSLSQCRTPRHPRAVDIEENAALAVVLTSARSGRRRQRNPSRGRARADHAGQPDGDRWRLVIGRRRRGPIQGRLAGATGGGCAEGDCAGAGARGDLQPHQGALRFRHIYSTSLSPQYAVSPCVSRLAYGFVTELRSVHFR